MKTRSPDEPPRQGLPPPPAPTARDANPWQMSSAPAGDMHPPRQPRAPGRAGRPSPPANGPARRKRGVPWFMLLVLFAIIGTGVQMVIRALAEGDLETAMGALVVFAVVAVVTLGRIMSRRKS